MPADPAVLIALAAAVDATPDGVPLRIHYATILVEAERPAERPRANARRPLGLPPTTPQLSPLPHEQRD